MSQSDLTAEQRLVFDHVATVLKARNRAQQQILRGGGAASRLDNTPLRLEFNRDQHTLLNQDQLTYVDTKIPRHRLRNIPGWKLELKIHPVTGRTQYVYGSTIAISVEDTYRLVAMIRGVAPTHSIHFNCGSHGSKDGHHTASVSAEEASEFGEGYFFLETLNVVVFKFGNKNASMHMVSSLSEPLLPPNANFVIIDWCYSSKTFEALEKKRKNEQQQKQQFAVAQGDRPMAAVTRDSGNRDRELEAAAAAALITAGAVLAFAAVRSLSRFLAHTDAPVLFDDHRKCCYIVDGGMLRQVPSSAMRLFKFADYHSELGNFNRCSTERGIPFPEDLVFARIGDKLFMQDCPPHAVGTPHRVWRQVAYPKKIYVNNENVLQMAALPMGEVVAEPFDSPAFWQTLTSHVAEIYENQRYFPLGGWGKKMLPSDRSKYSLRDGLAGPDGWPTNPDAPAPAGWMWRPGSKWEVEVTEDTSEDGFEYAFDFPASYYKQCAPTHFVRRRRWVRVMDIPPAEAAKITAVAEDERAKAMEEAIAAAAMEAAENGGEGGADAAPASVKKFLGVD